MSFIGPRPDMPDAINLYKETCISKLDVKPGMTGYSQATFRNSSSLEERFKGDVFYAKNVSLIFDLKILLKTVKILVTQKNIYRN